MHRFIIPNDGGEAKNEIPIIHHSHCLEFGYTQEVRLWKPKQKKLDSLALRTSWSFKKQTSRRKRRKGLGFPPRSRGILSWPSKCRNTCRKSATPWITSLTESSSPGTPAMSPRRRK